MKKFNLFLCGLTVCIFAIGCNKNSVEKTGNGQIQDPKDKITSGWYVVCVGGSGYLTSTGFLGGCGDADVDMVIMDVDVLVGQSIDMGDSNDKGFDKKLENHIKNSDIIFQKYGFYCECEDGRVYCASDIGDCEGICAEAAEIRKKYSHE